MTFNGEFTGTALDLQSELRSKIVIPFVIEVTIDCSSIESCWCFLQEIAIAGCTILFAQFTFASALNIYISIFFHTNTPFGIPVALLSLFPTTHMHDIKDNCFV